MAARHHTSTPDREPVGLDRAQCLALLGSVPVGRLVYTSHAMPAVLPLRFVLRHEVVYVRPGEAAGLRMTGDGVVVAFEADALDTVNHSGWSVVVLGRAVLETDPLVLSQLGELRLPTATGDGQPALRIPVELVTGRRLAPAALPGMAPVPPRHPLEHR